jgi:MSHA biogenesis protein MshQ
LTWDEVGIITLTPNLVDSDYLGVGNAIGTTSENIGRFIPDHFRVTPGNVVNRHLSNCTPTSSFTYVGEPLSVGSFGLIAYNAATTPAPTRNYMSDFAKFDGSTISNFGFGAVDLLDVTLPLAATAFALGSSPGQIDLISSSQQSGWSALSDNGTAAFSATLRLNRPNSPAPPYASFNIGIEPVDSDGVTIRQADKNLDLTAPADGVNDTVLIGNTKLRYGRLRLHNAYGSELLPVNVPVRAEYWTGEGFRLNTEDNCTSFLPSAVSLTAASPSTTISAAVTGSNIVLSGGLSRIPLSRPTSGSAENIRLCVDLYADVSPGVTCVSTASANMPWLQGRWHPNSTLYDDDPLARVTLGVHRTPRKIIHRREMY